MRTSITQHHICAVVNTEMDGSRRESPVRVLDVGCGNGSLIAFLQSQLPGLGGRTDIELYGFDVGDSRIQAPTYFDEAIRFLGDMHPEIDWNKRLSLIGSSDPWPYRDGYFDFVVSNHVMEHVHDHDFVFGQVSRVLKPNGISVHLFPLKYSVYEAHLKLPFLHWISNGDLLVSTLKWWSRIGVGKYREHRKSSGGTLELDDYAAKCADYMIYETNYSTLGQLYRCAKKHRMRCSFRYTGEFYRNKLRSLLRAPIQHRYSRKRRPAWERTSLLFYMLVSSITMILEKENLYSR